MTEKNYRTKREKINSELERIAAYKRENRLVAYDVLKAELTEEFMRGITRGGVFHLAQMGWQSAEQSGVAKACLLGCEKIRQLIKEN